MRLLGFALLAWCAATPALADRLCAGEAKGDGQQVSVVLRFDARERSILRAAYWKPRVTGTPAEGAGPPALSLGYDLAGDALGPLTSVGVLAWADLDPLPTSTSAWVQVRLGEGQTWAVPWTMYAENVARIEDIRRSFDGYAVGGFAGNVVVASAPAPGRRGRNAQLLSALAAAQAATVAIVGNADDEDLGRSTADVARTTVRDALFAKAYADASAAAADPTKCAKGG